MKGFIVAIRIENNTKIIINNKNKNVKQENQNARKQNP
jgi:hypothetical protein